MATNIQDLCNKVCGELPVGWAITIELELNSGGVTLIDPDGEDVEFPSSYESLEQRVIEALEYADSHDQEFK
jgi:hypothetical protein